MQAATSTRTKKGVRSRKMVKKNAVFPKKKKPQVLTSDGSCSSSEDEDETEDEITTVLTNTTS